MYHFFRADTYRARGTWSLYVPYTLQREMNDSSYRHTIQWVIAISLKVAPNEFGSSNEGKTERNFFTTYTSSKLSRRGITVLKKRVCPFYQKISQPLHFIENWNNKGKEKFLPSSSLLSKSLKSIDTTQMLIYFVRCVRRFTCFWLVKLRNPKATSRWIKSFVRILLHPLWVLDGLRKNDYRSDVSVD